jgi:hypothetical protein
MVSDSADTLLDRVLGVINDQCLSLQDLCAMLEIEEWELVERFKDRVVEQKEKFGIYENYFEEDSSKEETPLSFGEEQGE